MAKVDEIRLASAKARGSERDSREIRSDLALHIGTGRKLRKTMAGAQFPQGHEETPLQIIGLEQPSTSNAQTALRPRVVSMGYGPAAEEILFGGRPNDSFPVQHDGFPEPFTAMPSQGAADTNKNLTGPDYFATHRLTGESEISGERSTALVTLYGLLESVKEKIPQDKEWTLGSLETLLAADSPDFDLAFPRRDRPRSIAGGIIGSNIFSLASVEFETPAGLNPRQSVADSQPSVPIALVDPPIYSGTVAILSPSHHGRYVAPLTSVSERIDELILEEQGNEELLRERQNQALWLKQVMTSHWVAPLPQPFIGFDLDDGFFIASWQSDSECNTLTIDAKKRIGWYDPWPATENDNPMPEEVDLEAKGTWQRLRSALMTIRR